MGKWQTEKMVLCLAYRIYVAIVGFYDRESYFGLERVLKV
jgi:hypothetical protein